MGEGESRGRDEEEWVLSSARITFFFFFGELALAEDLRFFFLFLPSNKECNYERVVKSTKFLVNTIHKVNNKAKCLSISRYKSQAIQ